VDRELVVGFLEFDETNSTLWKENLRTYGKPPAELKADLVFGERTVGPESQYAFKETLNGFLYGNTKGLSMHVGERVRWYLMASTNFEMHSPHWHGNTVVAEHMRTDVAGLLPMGMLVADMVPDNPGEWLVHCHTAPHLLMGMEATYEVLPRQ
jgi:hypothetical protein